MAQADQVGEGPSSYGGPMPNLAPSGEFGNSAASGYQNVVNARVAENM